MRSGVVSVLFSPEAIVVALAAVYIVFPGFVTASQISEALVVFAVILFSRTFVLRVVSDDAFTSTNKRFLYFHFVVLNVVLLCFLYGFLGISGLLEVVTFQHTQSYFIWLLIITSNTYLSHFIKSETRERMTMMGSTILKFFVLLYVAMDLFSYFLFHYLSLQGFSLFGNTVVVDDARVVELLFVFVGFVVLDLLLLWFNAVLKKRIASRM